MKLVVSTDSTGGLSAIQVIDLPELNISDININTNEIKNNIKHFGDEGISSYVQKMTVIKQGHTEYIAVARRGGIVQLYDVMKGFELVKEWKGATKKADDAISALQYSNGKLCSCSVEGKVAIRDLTDDDSDFSYHVVEIRNPINAFRLHPFQPGIAAAGGKDNDVEIIRLYNPAQGMSNSLVSRPRMNTMRYAIGTRLEYDIGTRGYTSSSAPSFIPPARLKYLWKAKNSEKDQFGNKAPCWISDIQFLDLKRPINDGWRIASCTRFGFINIYETRVSSRPILKVEVSDHPLVNMMLGPDERTLWYADSFQTIGYIDGYHDVSKSISSDVRNFNCDPGTLISFDAIFSEGPNHGISNVFNDAISLTNSEDEMDTDHDIEMSVADNYNNLNRSNLNLQQQLPAPRRRLVSLNHSFETPLTLSSSLSTISLNSMSNGGAEGDDPSPSGPYIESVNERPLLPLDRSLLAITCGVDKKLHFYHLFQKESLLMNNNISNNSIKISSPFLNASKIEKVLNVSMKLLNLDLGSKLTNIVIVNDDNVMFPTIEEQLKTAANIERTYLAGQLQYLDEDNDLKRSRNEKSDDDNDNFNENDNEIKDKENRGKKKRQRKE